MSGKLTSALSSREKPFKLPAIEFPDPSLPVAIEPQTKADLDKMGAALSRLLEEDPGVRVERQTETTRCDMRRWPRCFLRPDAERTEVTIIDAETFDHRIRIGGRKGGRSPEAMLRACATIPSRPVPVRRRSTRPRRPSVPG